MTLLNQIRPKLRCVAAVCLFALTNPAGAGDSMAPEQVVTDFLQLLEANPAGAAALLTPDATVVVLDFGGPMMKAFRGFPNLLRQARCSPPGIKSVGQGEFGILASADIVSAEWSCSAPTTKMPPSTRIDFFVERQRIVGAVVHDPPGQKVKPAPFE